jgi:hypothetical protein
MISTSSGFFKYATALAVKYSKLLGRRPRITVTVIYPATVTRPPNPFFPDKELQDDKCLRITLNQIFLKEEIDFQRLIREFQARLDAHQPGDGKFSLT